MSDPIITLTTDFGDRSPYVAAMKGVILTINPAARIVDLSHAIPAQDVRHTAFFLRSALPHFPAGVIHVVVVDPGVGSERALLFVHTGKHQILVPDNGCWTLLEEARTPPTVLRLGPSPYWRQPLSRTFHGRDILAPAAGRLSLGVDPTAFAVVQESWVRLQQPPVRVLPDRLEGEVVFVDDFGNLVTNIGRTQLEALSGPLIFRISNRNIAGLVNAYVDAPPGSLVAIVSSQDTLEIAQSMGNAARELGVGVGTAVSVAVLPGEPNRQ